MIAATQIKVGNVIMHNGKPHRVTNVVHVTPGNWRGMVQTRLVNIETGSNTEHRFRSEDKVEKANMEQHSLQFSYRAGDEFHFMNTETYEMIPLGKDVLGEAVGYLIDGMTIEGGRGFCGGCVKSYGDHRIAMSFAIAGLSSARGIDIDDAACVDISFPTFFDLLAQICLH